MTMKIKYKVGKRLEKEKKVKLKIKTIFMMIIIMKYILKEKEKVI